MSAVLVVTLQCFEVPTVGSHRMKEHGNRPFGTSSMLTKISYQTSPTCLHLGHIPFIANKTEKIVVDDETVLFFWECLCCDCQLES